MTPSRGAGGVTPEGIFGRGLSLEELVSRGLSLRIVYKIMSEVIKLFSVSEVAGTCVFRLVR